ncbi:MAG TPA: ion transporter [Acidimicrobiales bacterium]|nr:ion transporter [Acidimicrobiales bacterium]
MEPAAPLRTRSPADEQRLADFERRMGLPIFVSAILPIVFSLAGKETLVSDAVMIAAWVVFIVDLVVHVRLVPGYLRTGWGRFDLVVVVATAPWFLIPGLGVGRFVVLARLARLVRIVKVGGKKAKSLAQQLGRVGIVTGALIFTCAYIAYSVEHPVNQAYATFGDAIWWATVTVTTVGYGDVYPITTAGRIAGVVLMFSGLGLLGVLAGALASFFGFGTEAEAEKPPAGDVASDLAALRSRLAEVDEAVTSLERRLR